MELKNKNVLITGASRGIGRAIAKTFAAEGANIALNYLSNENQANAAKSEVDQIGADSLLIRGDVADYGEAKKIVKTATDKLGSVDILINNAGLTSWKPMLDEDINYLHRLIDTNIKGVVNMTYAALPVIKKQGDGIIISTASGAGKTGYPNLAVYSASKFAVLGFTQALAGEVKDNNIRVYAVCPGLTATDMTGFSGTDPKKVAHRFVEVAREELDLESGQSTDIFS